ncbi:hypothetical protein L2E82_46583 [Cichorium intybus]|uniref:Uncharacterized protein n=1 Tax=Cichorium intybus TaxID=13427 RepID=A0ACB8YTQ0_CICIN|nr:hypothetical protein L2E82_46583 [Cichorium intybus]
MTIPLLHNLIHSFSFQYAAPYFLQTLPATSTIWPATPSPSLLLRLKLSTHPLKLSTPPPPVFLLWVLFFSWSPSPIEAVDTILELHERLDPIQGFNLLLRVSTSYSGSRLN